MSVHIHFDTVDVFKPPNIVTIKGLPLLHYIGTCHKVNEIKNVDVYWDFNGGSSKNIYMYILSFINGYSIKNYERYIWSTRDFPWTSLFGPD